MQTFELEKFRREDHKHTYKCYIDSDVHYHFSSVSVRGNEEYFTPTRHWGGTLSF